GRGGSGQDILDLKANSPAVRKRNMRQRDERNLDVPFGEHDEIALDKDGAAARGAMLLNDLVFRRMGEIDHAAFAMLGHRRDQWIPAVFVMRTRRPSERKM